MITVVQNFICTKRKRLELLKSELPNMSKVFKDYEFFVNYGSIENVFEVGQVYEDNIKKLSFEKLLFLPLVPLFFLWSSFPFL